MAEFSRRAFFGDTLGDRERRWATRMAKRAKPADAYLPYSQKTGVLVMSLQKKAQHLMCKK
jgi:hypothetical protein